MEVGSSTTNGMMERLLPLVCCLVLCGSLANAATVYFSDDFENGLEKWEVGGDTWRITEAFYRSASHSASESPDGGYPKNANSAMTMKLQYRVDLSGSTDPVLTFWHRIGVHGDDYGYVEISDDYGFTWTAIQSFTKTRCSTWSWVQLDLSMHKTSSILIRFRLRDNGDGAFRLLGWDIDDVEIREKETETMPFPLFDDFENGFENWQMSIVDAWQPTELLFRSDSHAISESPESGYPQNACSDVILARPIDLTASAFPVLTFWHRIGLHGDDYGHVDVSGDGGTTWSELVHYTNIIESTWARKQLDLREYRTSPVLIRFRLRDNGDGAYNLLGWDIDDVEIRELFYPPLEHALIVQITNVETGKCPTIQSTVLVTDVNGVAVGGLDASNFAVSEDDQSRSPITVEPSLSAIVVSLALDYSASMGVDAIADMEAAAGLFVDLMSPEDTGEIIKFADGIEVAQGCTADRVALIDAIQRPTTLNRSKTLLYDAIYQGISDIAERPGSKAVIAMSDGKNNNSQYGASQVISYAESTDVSVFTIGLGASVDEDALRAIAVQTGGVYYSAPTSDELVAVYEAISGALKNQYVVTYETGICEPNNPNALEHELEIAVSSGGAYGQGAKRFTCPTRCPSAIDADSDVDGAAKP